MNGEQAESVIKQLETIGVLGKKNEDGTHTVTVSYTHLDKDGKVHDTLTTDKNGPAESKELPICTYNEDGSFKEDIHYTVAVSYTHLINYKLLTIS